MNVVVKVFSPGDPEIAAETGRLLAFGYSVQELQASDGLDKVDYLDTPPTHLNRDKAVLLVATK